MPSIQLVLDANERVVGFGDDTVEAARQAAAAAASASTAANLIAQASAFADPDSTNASFAKLVGAPRIFGADPSKYYYFTYFFYDSISGGRLRITLTQADDDAGTGATAVAEHYVGSSRSTTGVEVVSLEELSGSGITAEVPVDLSAYFSSNLYGGGTFADAGLSNKVIVDTANWNTVVGSVALGKIDDEAEVADIFKLCPDDYVQRLFKRGKIAGADPDDTLWLNYETAYFGGIPLYRIRLWLHSTKLGAGAVAYWTRQSASELDESNLPATIHMTLKSDGATISANDSNGDPVQEKGITAVFEMDWTALDWTVTTATTYTSAANTAVGQRAIVTSDEIERAWLTGVVAPENRVTIGATNGQYATVVAAVQAFESSDAASTITRATYPVSDRIAPEWPVVFEVVDTLSETVGNFQDSSIWQPELRIPHGGILILRHDTLLKRVAAASNTSPVVEFNSTGRIIGNGATIENEDDEGYVIHMDGVNTISGRNGGGPMRRRITSVIENLHIKTASGNADPLVGMGLSDGQRAVFDRVLFERSSGSVVDAAMVVCHGSPNSTDPGLLRFQSCETLREGANGLVQVIKSTAGSHRHVLAVDDCKTSAITWGNTTDPDDGLSGWIARGRMSGLTIPTELQP